MCGLCGKIWHVAGGDYLPIAGGSGPGAGGWSIGVTATNAGLGGMAWSGAGAITAWAAGTEPPLSPGLVKEYVGNPTQASQNPTNDGTPTNGANPYVDSLVWGSASWSSSPGDPITYWFGEGTAPRPGGGSSVVGDAWSVPERAALVAALDNYAAVANLHFAPAADQASADIVEWQVPSSSWSQSGVAGQHGVPTGPADGQLNGWYNYQGSYWANLTAGGFGYNLLLHELGHGMGLAHPHDGGSQSDGNVFPGVTSNASTGTNQLNQGIWTVMSYVDGWSTVEPVSGNTYGHAKTLMAFDIAALQAIYGANASYRTGNDVYVIDTTNDLGTGWEAIWDAGGTDTITNEGAALGATIDLKAAPLDGSVNAAGYVSRAAGIKGGYTIANGAVIENAIGGNGADTLNGNQVSNTISGRDGADTINGGSGGDVLNGEGGDDVIVGDYTMVGDPGGPSGVGSSQPDTVVLPQSSTHSSAAAAYNVTNSFSTDADSDIASATTIPHTTVEAIGNNNFHFYRLDVTRGNVAVTVDIDRTNGFDAMVAIVAANGTTQLALDDDSATTDGAGGSSTELDSFLQYTLQSAGTYYVKVGSYGSSAIATLAAGSAYEVNISVADAPPAPPVGGDNGVAGNDQIDGGIGNDSLSGWLGADTLTGSTGNDTISGDDGDDVILATHDDGTDRISGGNGFDILDFSAVNGVVQINQLAGTVTGSAGNDTLLDVIEQIKGTNFDDVLSGGHGINVLDGEGGNDQFFGNNDTDLMRGGEGDDTFFFSTSDGNDTLLGGDGFDVLDYSSLEGVVQVNQLDGTTTGTADNDTLADVFEMVLGTAFGDVLSGGHGINSLKGNGGDDQIFANNGDDYTSGGDGNDTITMGEGNDVHDFRNGEDVDTILDFTAGGTEDQIDLRNYSGLGITDFAGLQASGRLSTVSGHAELALDSGDRIIFQSVASHTLLTAADFVFV